VKLTTARCRSAATAPASRDRRRFAGERGATITPAPRRIHDWMVTCPVSQNAAGGWSISRRVLFAAGPAPGETRSIKRLQRRAGQALPEYSAASDQAWSGY
jgi:hypothetical protein